jgi:hypothetical protein
MRHMLGSLLAALVCLCSPSFLWADGGTVRLSQREGNYRIAVLTAPTPLRAGPIDVSVLVQKATSDELVSEGKVTINATRRGHPGQAISQIATTEEATNKLFRAANFELRQPGWWDFEVVIDGSLGNAHAYFAAEAGEPLPKWIALWPWFSWPALAIALFGVHQLLVKTKRCQLPR